MNLSNLPPESLKHFAVIFQQAATLTSSHVKASQTLADFELKLSDPDAGLIMHEKYQKATRKRLKESVKIAEQNLKLLKGLGVEA